MGRPISPVDLDARATTRVVKSRALHFCPTKTFTVTVGQDANHEEFLVHEDIICKRSEFFQRAMSSNWAEHTTRLVKLPEDDPVIFALYVNLIYTNTIPIADSDTSSTVDKILSELIDLSSLYVLCEKLQDLKSKRSMLKVIQNIAKENTTGGTSYLPGLTAANIMYNGTPAGDPGRLWYAQLWSSVKTYVPSKLLEDFPKDFLVDLTVALLRKQHLEAKANTDPDPWANRAQGEQKRALIQSAVQRLKGESQDL